MNDGLRLSMQKLVLLFFLSIAYTNVAANSQIFIRINQLGYTPQENKECVILSKRDLSGFPLSIIDSQSRTSVFQVKLSESVGSVGDFNYCYRADFSSLKSTGKYFARIRLSNSPEFRIGENFYNPLVDSLLLFFKVQRCGNTQPYLHQACHLFDATNLIIDGRKFNKQIDVTGGWHDAGDFTKFLNTTAYSTYTLLFAYLFDPIKFRNDVDANGIPDILDEARIGLDWLLKVNYEKFKLVTQIQDLRDHSQGWRLPERDRLSLDRPAFVGMGKNLIGIYTATMALGYRVWKDIPNQFSFADKCLTIAENLYSIHQEVPNLDNSGTGAYRDTRYLGKMALGAVELYLSTDREQFLVDAKKFGTKAGADYWWSWGDINAYSHYRLAKIDTNFKQYLYKNLIFFEKKANKNLFEDAIQDTWGTNSTILGVALQAILWKDLTGDTRFDDLARKQRDYVLGKNQWGISFIYNIGTDYAKNFHSQIAYFNNGRLPGAVAAGSISRNKLSGYSLNYEKPDKYELFQTDNAVYRDDRMDYVTNEPTITANATAVFVMGYYAGLK